MEGQNSVTPEPAAADDGERRAIPLDLYPVVKPYLRHRGLSIRIEQLHPEASLSKGYNNGDRTWSLTPLELDDLVYITPEGVDGPHTLSVRIVSFDNNIAATLAVTDVTVTPGEARRSGGPGGSNRAGQDFEAAKAEWETETERRITEALQTAEREAAKAAWESETERRIAEALRVAERESAARLAEARESWQAEGDRRLGEATARLRQEVKQRAKASRAVGAAADKSKAEMERLLGELGKALEETQARAQTAEAAAKETSARLDAAETRAQQAETAAGDAGTQVRTEANEEIARLRAELDAARASRDDGLEDAERAALEDAKTAHADALARLQDDHARALEEQAAAIRVKLEAEFAARLNDARTEWEHGVDERIADAVHEAEETAGARLARAREDWQAEHAQDLEDLTARSERAEAALDVARTTENAGRDTEHFQLRDELETIRTALADRDAELAEAREKIARADRAGSSRGFEEKLADARAAWEQGANERLAEAVQETAEAAETRLNQAKRDWQAASDRALAEATARTEEAETALEDAREEWERRTEDRLAQAIREAEEAAEARLTLAHEQWQAESARALAEAMARAEKAEAALDKAHAETERAVENRLAEAVRKVEEDAEQRLARAREEWHAESARAVAEAAARAERAEAALGAAHGKDDTGRDTELYHLRDELAVTRTLLVTRDTELADARQEIDHLERNRAGRDFEARLANARDELEREFNERVAEAVRKAGEEAEARLAQLRERRRADIKAALTKAAETWKAHEAKRLETAWAEWQERTRESRSRGLPKAARRINRVRAARRLLRYGVIAACLAGAVMLYPRLSELWGPKTAELKGRMEPLLEKAASSVRSRLKNLRSVVTVKATVAVERANIRVSPSKSAAAVKTLRRGDTVTLLERKADWLLIRFAAGDDGVGWVHDSVLKIAPPE